MLREIFFYTYTMLERFQKDVTLPETLTSHLTCLRFGSSWDFSLRRTCRSSRRTFFFDFTFLFCYDFQFASSPILVHTIRHISHILLLIFITLFDLSFSRRVLICDIPRFSFRHDKLYSKLFYDSIGDLLGHNWRILFHHCFNFLSYQSAALI